MITDPIVKYWRAAAEPIVRGFSFIQRADPLSRRQSSPRDHGSTARSESWSFRRSSACGFRVSLTLSPGGP